VKPIRGQLVQLKAATRAASRVIWGSQCYMVPWLDGSVLIGATVEDAGFDEASTAAGVAALLAAGMRVLPALGTAAFEAVRVGLRPMTADELPAIGRSSTMRNVFYATGHYRNGVLLAPLTALLIADLVMDGRERPELALVRPGRIGL
jgi:glycine/D-amino acid oxidase-like deaminating enzyme